MATLEDLVVKVGADTDEAESTLDTFASKLDKNFGKITAAGAVAGAGLEGFARKMAPLNEQNAQLAAMTGMSSDAMRDLAIDTANVTFPLEDVQSLMRTASERGLEGADALQEYATFWDTVGDATGEAGPALGEAGVALAAVGIAAGQEKDALAAFGFITDNTTGSVGDFLKFLERTGPELRELGADVDDSAAILGILESEFGMTGRTARQEFRSAVGEADGDMGKLLDTLGISEEQFASMRSEVDASSDVIQRNADIHAESYTPLERLTHGAEELMFKYGGLADTAGALALPMMALGPISKGVSAGIKGMGAAARGMKLGAATKAVASFGAASAKATGRVIAATAAIVAKGIALAATRVAIIAATVVQWAWNVAMMANPIGLIIAGILLLVGLFVLLWTQSETFRNIVTGAFNAVWTAVQFVWEWIKNNWPLLLAILTGPIGVAVLLIVKNWDKIKNAFFVVRDAIVGAVHWVRDKFKAAFNKAKEFVQDAWDNIKKVPGKLKNAFNKVTEFVSRPFKAGFNAVANAWNNTVGKLSWTVPDWVPVIGGNSLSAPTLPTFHTGGISDQEQLAVLRKDEGVFTRDQMQALGMALSDRAGGGGKRINVEQLTVQAWSERFRLSQVIDELEMAGAA